MTGERFGESDVRATYRFLAHAGLGVTEMRIISPDHEVLGIGFFDNEEAFVAACVAANGRGNVYVGIQPRPASFLERAANRVERLRSGAHDQDIEHLTALVVDLDPIRPKDAASTTEELARAVGRADQVAAWVESKGYRRPIRNMSGNGCHLWFALPPRAVEEIGRDELTRRLKAFEARLREKFSDGEVKIDSIYNLSRIIKVIGTLSCKGEDTTDRPWRVSASLDPFERTEDAGLLEAILTRPLGDEDRQQALRPAATPVDVAIGSELSPWLHALLSSNTRLTALFEGRGKTVIGPDGKRLDTSSSGYDFSLALSLAQKGVTDPSEIATALFHRPDGAARAKGDIYIRRTAQRALALAATLSKDKRTGDASAAAGGGAGGGGGEADGGEAGPPPEPIDFKVTKLIVSDSVPPMYELHIDGEGVLALSTDELINPKRFRKCFFERLRRLPRLPGKGSPMSWADYVNLWSAVAEVVHQPPEASRTGLVLQEMVAVIDNLGEADTIEDLERGRAVRVDGRRAFKTRTVLRSLRESLAGEIGTHEVCSLLRKLGCTNELVRLEGTRVRLWVAPTAWPATVEEGEPVKARPSSTGAGRTSL